MTAYKLQVIIMRTKEKMHLLRASYQLLVVVQPLICGSMSDHEDESNGIYMGAVAVGCAE